MLVGEGRKFLSCLVTIKVDVDQETMEPLNTLAPAALDWCRMIGSEVGNQSCHIFKILILQKYCTLLYEAKKNCKFTVRGIKKL